jgi:serine/threonine protein kinase
VFEAWDFQTGRTVALKVVHPHLSGSPEMRRSFLREASVAEGLGHPNITRVLGYGVHGPDGERFAWIALERAPGMSLTEGVGLAGALDPEDALTVANGVLAALDAMHAERTVHRDVTPTNVIVDYPGEGSLRTSDFRLLDFGLADIVGRPTTASDVVRSKGRDGGLTGVLGSVNYMSPEQVMGRPVGQRGDIYQAGTTLYFALTGLAPYRHPTPDAVIRAHFEARPPVPSVLSPGIPRAVDRIVVTAMNTDEAGRFSSAASMREAVQLAFTKALVVNRTQLFDTPPDNGSRRNVTAVYGGGGNSGFYSPPLAKLTTPPRQALRNRRLALAITTGAITSVMAIAWILAVNSAPTASSATAPLASVVATPQPSLVPEDPPHPAAVPAVDLPTLVALSLDSARTALTLVGLSLGTVSWINSPAGIGTVLSTAGVRGGRVAVDTRIDLVVTSGSNSVPRVAGLTLSGALTAIRGAGFSAGKHDQADADHARDSVLGSVPGETVVLAVGSEVVVDVSVPVTTVPVTSPTPAHSPTPTPTASSPPPTGTATS